MRNVLDEERTASSSFLDTMLTAPPNRDPDKAFIIQFARSGSSCSRTWPPPAPCSKTAIRDIDSSGSANQSDPNDSRRSSGGRGSKGRWHHPLRRHLPRRRRDHGQARKAAKLLSSSPTASIAADESLTSAIEAAQRADTIIYAIYFKGEDHQSYNNGGNHGGGRSRLSWRRRPDTPEVEGR